MTDTKPVTPDAADSAADNPGARKGQGQAASGTSVPDHTGSRATRVLGVLALLSLPLWAMYSLVWSPEDADMGDAVRLFYVHVPIVGFLSLACVITTVSSAMWLRKRTAGWDALAVSSAEMALLLGVLTLVTGAIWGRPTWGTYWSWDPRLTTSALLVVLILGYLVLRWVFTGGGAENPDNLVPAAIVGLLFLPNVIVVRYSVDWWDSLHQSATINTLDPKIEGDMHVAWLFGMLTAALAFVWLMIHRFRVAYLAQQVSKHDLEAAVAARRAEASEEAQQPEGGNT